MIFTTKPSRRETILGGIYLLLSMFVLPFLLPAVNAMMGSPFDIIQVNFIYFFLNFAAATVIFRKYLIQSLRDALKVPFPTVWYAVLGYLGNQTLSSLVVIFCLWVYPEFANINDGNIAGMLSENFPLMFIGTVLLAPVYEELLYRGLIFRGLWDRSPAAAHVVSILVFSSLHIVGYIGAYEPMHLLLCFLQYIPAAYCLNFAYRYSGSILSPILMHMLTNLMALSAMPR